MGGIMKKLTITVDDEVYKGLHARIGRGNISRFLNDMARSHVVADDIEAGYLAMAADKEREQEAFAWAEQGVADLNHDET
jgi:predicted CopG family antitoxin